MTVLYIAANYVTSSEPAWYVRKALENSGHLQIIYGDQELEVQSPWEVGVIC